MFVCLLTGDDDDDDDPHNQYFLSKNGRCACRLLLDGWTDEASQLPYKEEEVIIRK